MERIFYAENLNLSHLVLDLNTGCSLEFLSSYDGSDAALIECGHIMRLNLESSLGYDFSELPVLVGEVSVDAIAAGEIAAFLKSRKYGFTFYYANPDPDAPLYHLKVVGGELEMEIIARKCTVRTDF